MKKRIAIFMHGGVGGGFYSQGQPNIASLVEKLSLNYELIVYSQFKANNDFDPSGFKFYSAPENIKKGIFRWVYLIQLFLKNKRVDILYSFWGYPAGFIVVALGKLFKIKTIIHLQGGDVVWIPSIKYGVLSNPFKNVIIKWTYKNANEIIALTNYQNKFFQQIVKRKVNVIPFGTDTVLFPFNNKSKEGVLHCLHIGNLNSVKDQKSLLRCFKELTRFLPAELQIVGLGPMEDQLKDECVKLEIEQNVKFVGFYPHEKIQHFMKWAHVLIHTSFYEGQCLAVTEAASSGVLIAGFSVGIISDLGNECCVVSNIRHPKILSDNIFNIVTNQDEWNYRLNNARRWSEEHSSECTLKKIMSLIND